MVVVGDKWEIMRFYEFMLALTFLVDMLVFLMIHMIVPNRSILGLWYSGNRQGH